MARVVISKRVLGRSKSAVPVHLPFEVKEDCHEIMLGDVDVRFSRVTKVDDQPCDYPILEVGSYWAGYMPIAVEMTYDEAESLLNEIRLVLEKHKKARGE